MGSHSAWKTDKNMLMSKQMQTPIFPCLLLFANTKTLEQTSGSIKKNLEEI